MSDDQKRIHELEDVLKEFVEAYERLGAAEQARPLKHEHIEGARETLNSARDKARKLL